MNVTVIGAGNSGLAMAGHLSSYGNCVTLWNRSRSNIEKLMSTKKIRCEGIVNGNFSIHNVTDNIEQAIIDPDVIFITTPANSHKEIAEAIANKIKKETIIVLNPGRTFGALEFRKKYDSINTRHKQCIAETQTILYTCRKTEKDAVNIIALKTGVLLSTIDSSKNINIISKLPECIQRYFVPAKSMIETSIGNVGMILHCAPLLLNSGWTESERNIYNYYYDGITPSIGRFIEKLDNERVAVSIKLGLEVESTQDWLRRTYNTKGSNLYECIHNNESYKTIDAPKSLNHRYIFEDIPCGLVPLESVGKILGLEMRSTSLIIDLASSMLGINFRKIGRNIVDYCDVSSCDNIKTLFIRRDL